jgi:hypothetical protein
LEVEPTILLERAVSSGGVELPIGSDVGIAIVLNLGSFLIRVGIDVNVVGEEFQS